jgi:acetate kinase
MALDAAMTILALNAGSSSLKFCIASADRPALFTGEAEHFGRPAASLKIRDGAGALAHQAAPPTLQDAAGIVLDFARGSDISAIGHRFVHGGPSLTDHRIIDAAVRSALTEASAIAPLHNPPALDVLRLAEAAFPGIPHIACLDTAFHADMPQAAQRLPIAPELARPGVRRYGFHGLSCESIVHQLDPCPPRLIIAHLGSGCSVTAVRDGRSVDTSMGFTPDGGVMMATRSGDIDPGLLIYLLRQGETADRLEDLLSRHSGLAGLSGRGGDLRDVEAAGDENARLALEMFAASIAKAIAALATVLGGIDLVAFTGGIGEHDDAMRRAILARLTCLGSFAARIYPAQEEAMIVRHTARLTDAVGL